MQIFASSIPGSVPVLVCKIDISNGAYSKIFLDLNMSCDSPSIRDRVIINTSPLLSLARAAYWACCIAANFAGPTE